MAQEKCRHFVVKQTALHAVGEVVRRLLKMSVLWDCSAERGEGLGQHLWVPVRIGNEQDISTQVAEPIGQQGKKISR